MFATAMLSATFVTGCKEDPPPPPPVAASGDVVGSAQGPAVATANPQRGGKIPRVDPETTKRSRVEACYWGSMGAAVTRDAYLKSMKDAAPSADNLPDFGTFPEHIKRAEAMKKAGREVPTRATNMPYLRHLRSCKHAKSAAGVKLAGVDEALAEWEPYASKLHETLVKATRYYGRKTYEKDDFKEAKAYHDTLMELFPQFDEKLASFQGAVDAWRKDDAGFKSSVELDEGGKVAQEALGKARELTVLMMAESRDAAAITPLLDKLDGLAGELATLREEKRRPPHPKVFGPKLTEFVAVARTAAETEGQLDAAGLYPITSGLALMYELHQRSMEQLLRQRNAGRRKPLRTLDPRRKDIKRSGAGAGDATKAKARGIAR